MVGGEVEPGADLGAKCSLWSSRNDDASTTNTSVVGSSMAVDQRHLVVAGRDRLHTGRQQHVGDQRGDGGLAVGAR